jgi:hypothetical protein
MCKNGNHFDSISITCSFGQELPNDGGREELDDVENDVRLVDEERPQHCRQVILKIRADILGSKNDGNLPKF